jgi:hypothetical protein
VFAMRFRDDFAGNESERLPWDSVGEAHS